MITSANIADSYASNEAKVNSLNVDIINVLENCLRKWTMDREEFENLLMEMEHPICSKKKAKHARRLLRMYRHNALSRYDATTNTISNSYNNHTNFQNIAEIRITVLHLLFPAEVEVKDDIIYGQDNIVYVANDPDRPEKHESMKGLKCKQEYCNCWRTAVHKWNQEHLQHCLLYTSPSPRDRTRSRMPSSA